MDQILQSSTGFLYRNILKPVLFRFDAERVHETMVDFGSVSAKFPPSRWLLQSVFRYESGVLAQTIAGIRFPGPVGLAAGFDYKAKLPHVLPLLGFGFGTVGTISNLPCPGNPRPRLGRLPQSRSLLVNKGFRNPGADAVIRELDGVDFSIPIGVSIGRTNIAAVSTPDASIRDIVSAFGKFEKSGVRNSYYELNISCPNLRKPIDMYSPRNLNALLDAVSAMKIRKPVFIKMPIGKTDREILDMMEIIAAHRIPAVIIGNLQTDRNDPSIRPEEASKFAKGNFSGKPTERRSNELIRLVYRKYGRKVKIIGCGGIFSAEDAYKKISLGASLVQMITGMIYRGPQVIGEINRGLAGIVSDNHVQGISALTGQSARCNTQ